MLQEKRAKTNVHIRAKGWFLTYPQCPIEKEQLLEKLREKYTIQEYVIAREKHEDGNFHLHAFIKIDKRMYFKPNMFDVLQYVGHYEPALSWKAVQKYCKKGGDFIASFNVDMAEQKKAKLAQEDWEADPLDLLEKGKIDFMELDKFTKNQNLYKILKQKRQRPPEQPLEKRRHEWWYGESNTGKTTKLRELIRKDENNWFQIPYNNDWVGYNGEENLYADEYKGQLTVQELNRICDGGSKMNVKGGTVQLSYNVKVYIVSNYDIENCYKNIDGVQLKALNNRFKVVEHANLGLNN